MLPGSLLLDVEVPLLDVAVAHVLIVADGEGQRSAAGDAALANGLLKKRFGAPTILPLTVAPAVACAPSAMAKMAFEICGV